MPVPVPVPVPVIVPRFAMTMVVLGELRLVTMRVTVAIDDDRNRELVWLGDFLNRLPIAAAIGKFEVLARVILAAGLDRNSVGFYTGQPETRGHAILEDFEHHDACAGRYAVRLIMLMPFMRMPVSVAPYG